MTPRCGIFHLVVDLGSTFTDRVSSVEDGAPVLGQGAPLNPLLVHWLAREMLV